MRNFGSMEKFYCHFKGNVYRLVGIAKDRGAPDNVTAVLVAC